MCKLRQLVAPKDENERRTGATQQNYSVQAPWIAGSPNGGQLFCMEETGGMVREVC